MTGWLIFGGIIILILGILMIPVHAAADYKKDFSLWIRFLFFFKIQILPMKKKNEKEEKPKEEKSEEKKTKKEKPEKEKRKMTAEEIVDMTVDIVNKYGPGAKMILRNIRFHRLELFWKIGGEDAAEIGIKYGRICAWLSGVLGFFRNFMKIEKAKFRVFPDFISERDEVCGGADIEFNPLVVIIGALRMAFVFLGDMIKNNKNKSPKANHKLQNKKIKESA